VGNFFSKGRTRRKRSVVGVLITAVSGVLGAQLVWSGTAIAAPVLQPCSASYIGVPGSGQSSTSSVEMDTLGTWVQVNSAKAGQQLRNSTLLSYPAVAWYRYVTPSLSFNWNGLGSSEVTGEAKLTALINSDRAQAGAAGCPNAPILMAAPAPFLAGSPGTQPYRRKPTVARRSGHLGLVAWPSSASSAAPGQKEARADRPAWATSMSWL